MDAAAIAREAFGLGDVSASALPGERDLNFLLENGTGARYVLKVHDPGADPAALDLQDAAMRHVAGLPVPRVVGEATRHGDRIVRLLSWLDGTPWLHAGPHDAARMEDLGANVARLDAALSDFEHPAMRRELDWNLTAAPRVAERAALIDPARRPLVDDVFARYVSRVEPRLGELPHQVIHNDANELNVLVGADGLVAGLIDFGDVVWSPRVCGLAVAGAYAMTGQADPVRAVAPLVRGYDQVTPLNALELELLYDLMRTRLAMSVCMAAFQHAADPANDYLLVSQAAVWELLERLAGESPQLAHFRLRDACGWEAVPHARAVRQHFESGAARPRSVLETDVATADAVVLDIADGIESPPELSIGRYGEDRRVYTAPQFGDGSGRRRTLHLGVDLFAAAGTPILAPLDGVVHATAYNPAPLDYGGVVILAHETGDGVPFWTLYGHLDPHSFTVAAGAPVTAGDRIAALGAEDCNGGWPPHLHLQMLTSLVDAGTDVPGVGYLDEADVWKSISPDPNLLLGRAGGDAARTPRATVDIARRRTTNLSRSLSLAYAEPLHIVRGEGAHLYDAGGKRYLDLVNNVCHVGHCHPRVVAAGQRQMALLNTNTRYLHESVVDYARRLADTLPDPLRVVFFVNSGAEANDLALRLVHAHTRARDVLVLDHAYHGALSSQIDLSPYKFEGRGGFGAPAHTHVCELPDPYRGRTLESALDSVGARLRDLGAPPAALFAESLQGCGGQIVYPDGYLRGAFDAVRAAGGLCVVDEVQVGFGRVGSHFWGFETQAVVPDVVTMGKPMGNGHPLAAVVTTPEVAASFVTGMEYFNTFGGNPVSAEIGMAVLDVIRDERLQAHARTTGDYLTGGLRRLGEEHDLIGDVRGRGLFIGVELSVGGDPLTPATDAARLVKEAARERGVLISTDGPDDNVLKIKPPLVISRDDCDLFLAVLEEALRAQAE